MDRRHTRELENRLTIIEKQFRMMKLGIGAAILCMLLTLCLWSGVGYEASAHASEPSASSAPHVIRAEAFELVDNQGSVRARLVLREGIPCLSFLDPNGLERLVLSMNSVQFRYGETRQAMLGSSGLSFSPANGQEGASYTAQGVMLLERNKAKTSLVAGGIRLWDRAGVEKADLEALNGLRLYGDDGREKINLQPWHGMQMFGPGRSPGASILSIKIIDAENHTRAYLGQSFGIWDAAGKAVSPSNTDLLPSPNSVPFRSTDR